MKETIKQMVERGIKINGVIPSLAELNTALNLAEKAGAAKKVGEQRSESGRGKPAVLWEINADFTIKFE